MAEAVAEAVAETVAEAVGSSHLGQVELVDSAAEEGEEGHSKPI